MDTRRILIEGMGTFRVPTDTEAHSLDGERCVRSIVGWRDPELARSNGEWGERCGQEYSYRRDEAEDVRTVLDIGCNIGAYTVWACRVWWPATVQRVWSYDPNGSAVLYADINMGLVQRDVFVALHTRAVAANPSVLFHEDERWGCSWTGDHMLPERKPVGQPRAIRSDHPRNLPKCDAVKCDAEGAEGDLLLHYPYWPTVKVLQMEWHTDDYRELMHQVAADAGLTKVKDDCGQSSQGVACWVRR
jgi:FkbM family methyltransferase